MPRCTHIALLVCALPFVAAAQQAANGTITGTVTDASQAAIPNARITARNINTNLERTTTSSEIGFYTLTPLPVGDYELTATAQGFNDVKAGPVRVGVGQSITVELPMTVGAVTSQLQVEAAAAAIETTRASTASTVDNTQISNLGVNGRDFLAFLLLTPGVTRDVRTGDLSFGGQRGTLNNLQVDGSDNNNNFYGQALGRTGTGRAPAAPPISSAWIRWKSSRSTAAATPPSSGAREARSPTWSRNPELTRYMVRRSNFSATAT